MSCSTTLDLEGTSVQFRRQRLLDPWPTSRLVQRLANRRSSREWRRSLKLQPSSRNQRVRSTKHSDQSQFFHSSVPTLIYDRSKPCLCQHNCSGDCFINMIIPNQNALKLKPRKILLTSSIFTISCHSISLAFLLDSILYQLFFCIDTTKRHL